MTIRKLKERVYQANMELPRQGLVMYTFGNVSGIDRERGIIAIKPSGVPYEDLTPDSMVLVDLDNKTVESGLNPSSDTNTHTALYRAFPDIGGIAHTHSTYATSWAQAETPIPCLGTTHADHLPGPIPCTRRLTDCEIAGDYETLTGMVIAELFEFISYEEIPMALVAGHGPFTWGDSPEKAVYNSVIAEQLAKTAYLTRAINPGAPALAKALIDRHYYRKHGDSAYYGQKQGN